MLLWTPPCLAATTGAWWVTSSDPTFAALQDWSNKVEIGDLDGDDDLDVVIANGGDYSTPGSPEVTRLLLNDGLGAFTELSVPETLGLHRVAKIRDFDGDGVPDLFLGGAWQTPSVLLLGDGAGGFVDASLGLPKDALSVGDAEAGDVDDDGDLDLVLADSGPGNALVSAGGFTRLWRNDGVGGFVDDSVASMPVIKVKWSWDLELLDVDGDFDLDAAVSCKTCQAQYLYVNDGGGGFTDASASMPASTNNYDFEGLDLTGDGLLDLVTINDGPGLHERILVNDGAGGFVDETAARLPNTENPGEDDNVAVLLDADDDADVDLLIGSLSGDDRLFLNDGSGNFVQQPGAIDGPASPGTLGMAAADLTGDGRLDLVDVQGEAAFKDYLRIGAGVAVDTTPPAAGAPESGERPPGSAVHASVHDYRSPIAPGELTVTLDYATATETGALPMGSMGHALYRAVLDLPAGTEGTWHVCATDRVGNTGCSADVAFAVAGPTEPPTTGDTGGPPPTGDSGGPPSTDDTATGGGADGDDGGKGCGCDGARAPAAVPWVVMLVALRRRARAAAGRSL